MQSTIPPARAGTAYIWLIRGLNYSFKKRHFLTALECNPVSSLLSSLLDFNRALRHSRSILRLAPHKNTRDPAAIARPSLRKLPLFDSTSTCHTTRTHAHSQQVCGRLSESECRDGDSLSLFRSFRRTVLCLSRPQYCGICCHLPHRAARMGPLLVIAYSCHIYQTTNCIFSFAFFSSFSFFFSSSHFFNTQTHLTAR